MKHKLSSIFLLLFALILLTFPVSAEGQATDISDQSLIVENSKLPSNGNLFDGKYQEAARYEDGCWVKLSHESGIGALYVVMDEPYGTVSLLDYETGDKVDYDTQGMLHVVLDLELLFGHPSKTIRLTFSSGPVLLNEIRVFTAGTLPDWVQNWDSPADGHADLVLFSTHADDEQLFFAGLLPYYAGELGYDVQVVTLTNHYNWNHYRCHELLDALWAVGVRHYPVIGQFPDIKTKTVKDAYSSLDYQGYPEEELLDYVVTQLRRFKPYVAVGHDLAGEYGHGAHMLYAELLTKAVELSGDPAQYPDSAEQYGTWDVPKTYLHLYEENQLVMDWDKPLKAFDGKSAYQVSKLDGFPCHKSQVKDFEWYFAGAQKATEVEQYSPCLYGLYRTTVGEDVQKDDFFEHIRRDPNRGVKEEPAEEAAALEEELPTEAQTEPPTQPEPQKTQEPEKIISAENEGKWVLYPMIGAVIVLIIAVFVNLKNKKKNM